MTSVGREGHTSSPVTWPSMVYPLPRGIATNSRMWVVKATSQEISECRTWLRTYDPRSHGNPVLVQMYTVENYNMREFSAYKPADHCQEKCYRLEESWECLRRLTVVHFCQWLAGSLVCLSHFCSAADLSMHSHCRPRFSRLRNKDADLGF